MRDGHAMAADPSGEREVDREVDREVGAPDDADSAIRVVIADDQAMIRLGLRMILDHEPGIVTVGEARDGAEAVEAARAWRPDVVLMDVRMPVVDGVEATRRIRADPDLDGVRVAVLTTFDDEEYVTGALHAGADAFLLKDTDPGTLVAAVQRVSAGGSMLDPAATVLVLGQWRSSVPSLGRPAAAASAVGSLTPRELEVLRAVARGGANAAIATAMGISLTTVKAHVHALLGKLGCTARAQLVVVAYESGVVVPGV
ncbi:response regulator transcription factor [Cellulomonas sp. KRMCY2]|uniref:response regulator n=1 Tax=Cellulomonas sp. KRMCY2 TaxID=1304865 RepID=UPI00045EB3E6|nr:response regulator transcription factor [Cellulomonas sp. KRMCY2]